MIIDQRIYATAGALLLTWLSGTCAVGMATISNAHWQRRAEISWRAGLVSTVVIALAGYLDWLWS